MISCWIISPTLFFVIRHLVSDVATLTLLYMLLLHSITQYIRGGGGGQGQLNFIFIQHMYVCFSWNIQSDLIQGSLSFRENEICFHNQSPFRRYSYLPSGKFCIRENNILRCESI